MISTLERAAWLRQLPAKRPRRSPAPKPDGFAKHCRMMASDLETDPHQVKEMIAPLWPTIQTMICESASNLDPVRIDM
jgi:hypothetical protein